MIAGWLVAFVVAASGCAHVSDGPGTGSSTSTQTSGAPTSLPASAARQRISEGFGAQILVDEQRVRDGVPALDALRATTPVETAFGGGFVAGMYGRHSSQSPKRDWMYFVNGVAPGVGAGDYTVRPGDRIWWDFRTWGDETPLLPAVVGSWPEPFVHGYPSGVATVQVDEPLRTALVNMGVTVSTAASSWRVIVGANDDLIARDPAWRAAMADPDGAGLAVRFVAGHVERLDVDARHMVRVTAGRAIAAMVLSKSSAEQGGVVFAVAGLDRASAAAAAATIATHPQVLAGRIAVVFDGAGMPVASAGRGAP